MTIKLETRCGCHKFMGMPWASPLDCPTWKVALASYRRAQWPPDESAIFSHYREFVFRGNYDPESGAPIYQETE